jgi:hypothetical protein
MITEHDIEVQQFPQRIVGVGGWMSELACVDDGDGVVNQ